MWHPKWKEKQPVKMDAKIILAEWTIRWPESQTILASVSNNLLGGDTRLLVLLQDDERVGFVLFVGLQVAC